MKTSEILDKAADVNKRNGWVQGGFTARHGSGRTSGAPCDVLGAIGIAAHGKPWHLKGATGPLRALADHLGVTADVEALARWNDAEGRTAEEVVRELRAAAASERRAGR